jgi:MYXO-CTERM domain-containing protein
LNGGATIFTQTFNAPFSDPSVQSAILAADALFTSDGAMFGSPLLTSNFTALRSSVLSYVATSPTFDVPTRLACGALDAVFTCSGVTVMDAVTETTTFGPNTIMIGLGSTDEFDILAGQQDENISSDYTYTVSQNAVTTNTYLTTQSYVIDGTTSSSVPGPSTFVLLGAALIAGSAALRRRRAQP